MSPCATLTVTMPAQPNIRLEYVWTSPEGSGSVGSPVSIYARFQNYGNAAGSISASATVNGQSVGSTNADLAAGAGMDLKVATWTPSSAGTYSISVTSNWGSGSTSYTAVSAPQPTYYTVRWFWYYSSGYEQNPLWWPGDQQVPAGGTAKGNASWKATKTGTATVMLFYSGSWHTVGTVYQVSGNTVTFEVGVGNVQSDLNVTIGVKLP